MSLLGLLPAFLSVAFTGLRIAFYILGILCMAKYLSEHRT